MSYPECVEVARKLIAYLARFKYEDACRAVFCMNSWYRNRSAQQCAMAMNAALLTIEHFGDEPIGNYSDFQSSAKEIIRLCPVSPFEDYVIPVMGHTKVPFAGRWRPAMYGCGMIHEYAMLFFSEPVCRQADREGAFESLLEYVESMASLLQGGGWDGEEVYTVGLYVPPVEHWNNVTELFAAELPAALPSEVREELSSVDSPVERVHFIGREGGCLPLFNASILLDYMKSCCDLLSDDTLAEIASGRIALEADRVFYNPNSRRSGLLLGPVFKNGDDYVNNCPIDFMLFDDTGTITIFYYLGLGDGNNGELRKGLAQNPADYRIIEAFERNGKHRGLSFTSMTRVNLVAYVNDIVPQGTPSLMRLSQVADVTCGALDLLSILHAASSIEEINSYFSELADKKHQVMPGMAGIFPHFLAWVDSDRNIFAGAEDAHTEFFFQGDFNDNDAFYCELFTRGFADFPFVDESFPFGYPFSMRFEEQDRGFVLASEKRNGRSIGIGRRIGDEQGYIWITADFGNLEQLVPQELEGIGESYAIASDALVKLVDSAAGSFGELAESFGGLAAFEYVPPFSPAAQNLTLVDPELGIRVGRAMHRDNLVLFTFDARLFMDAVISATNREVECRLGEAVISALGTDSTAARNAIDAIKALRNEAKLVSVRNIELPYVWRPSPVEIEEDDVSRKAALKRVAIAVDDAGAKPGAYQGKEANEALRGFQDSLTGALREELGRFRAGPLVEGLLEACADASHAFFINTKKATSFDDIDGGEAIAFEDRTLNTREDSRSVIRASRYCLETVLAFGLDGEEVPAPADLSFLVSLAVQCVGLLDIADVMLFGPKGTAIEIEENKTVRVIEDDDVIEVSKEVKRRSLSGPGHVLKDRQVDIEYVGKAKAAFEKDTGVSFDLFLSTLEELAKNTETGGDFKLARPNVVSVREDALVSRIVESLKGHWDEEDVRRSIEDLKVDPGALMSVEGKALGYLPFNRVKDRPNRLELKPLIPLNGKLLYSPVCAGLLERRWINGLAQRFIPVKSYKGLNSVLEEWKRIYEKALETDVRDCFVSHGFDRKAVLKSAKLHKHGDHPKYLGDYDCLAYDADSETIWCIECKEFEKVESGYDYYQLQQRWFGEGGKLQKFERRIKYLNDNIDQIADDLGFSHSGKMRVKAYVVSNKPFANMINKSNFEIVTLSELGRMLDASQ
jgi:hypothetical protein